MRFVRRFAIALMALAPILTLATPRAAAGDSGDTPGVSVSGESFVPKGVVHEGDLVSVLGDVRIDGEVTGQVVVVMGSLELSGTVRGDCVSVMTRTHLAPSAQVDGEMVNVGWSPARDPGSRIAGQLVNVNFMNLVPFAGHGGGLSGIIRFLFILRLIRLAFLFLMLFLIAALIPRRLAIMAAAFPGRWGAALLTGLLVYVGVLLAMVILVATLIGIPLALFLWFVVKVIKWVGLAAILYLMGNSAGRNLFRRDLPHLASVLCGFVIFAVINLVPILGWLFGMVMSALALGTALVTRFGTEVQPAMMPAPPGAAPAGPPAGSPTTGSQDPAIGAPPAPQAPPVVS